MLLSGPPSTLIFFEPRIEVNPVVHAAAPELDERNPELGKQGNADAEIPGGVLFRKAANWAQRRPGLFHFIR
jgi:hypothetical protein